MQNNNSISKWSDVKGLAVVAIDSGKKVGTLDNFYFDPHTNTVLALVIKTGVFGQRILMSSSIHAIGSDAITIADETILTTKHSDNKLDELALGDNLLAYKVLSEGGNFIGNIGNISLNLNTPDKLQIAAFELTGNLLTHFTGHYPTFAADQVLRYGQDVIVIPDTLAQALTTK